jgi:hypothetical protein
MISGSLAEAAICGRYKVYNQTVEFETYDQTLDIFYNRGDDRLPQVGFTNHKIHNMLLDFYPMWWEETRSYGLCKIYELSRDYVSATQVKLGDVAPMYVAHYNHVLMMYLLQDNMVGYSRLIRYVRDKKLPLTLEKFGRMNIPTNYMLAAARFYDRETESAKLPKNLYPAEGECNAEGSFDYSSQYFRIDGQ